MIIVTGGSGFIGSNIVRTLNQQGKKNIIVVDDLTDGSKFKNIAGYDIVDYLDKEDFLDKVTSNHFFSNSEKIEAVFHEGACSDTTEWDGRFMMRNNYEYSKSVLHYCLQNLIPFIYASSAAVYGSGTTFKESREYEEPLNVYGYSKWQFDQYVRHLLPSAKSQITGLRYFNVYGPHEQHKGSMASVAFHHYQQLNNGDVVKLFEGCDGYGNGEQRRDFIYVGDVVAVNLWFLATKKSGIYNVGTGRSQTFNDVANAVIKARQRGQIQYIPFPEHLKGRYQSFTQADISALRAAGYSLPFKTVEEGVEDYFHHLKSS